MKYILKGCYIHRDKLITKCPHGWEVENCLDIFKTLDDAKQYINKIHDGSNLKIPEITGSILYNDIEDKMIYEAIK